LSTSARNIETYVADVIVVIFQMEHLALDFDNLAAETRCASAKYVDLAIDHFG